MAASDLHDIATKWLYGFSQGLASGNPSFVSELFTEDSWLRDVLTFSWDSRSLRGPSAIAAYLKESLKTIDIANVALDMARSGMEPQLSPHIPGGVEFGFVFETVIGFHRGHTRLTRTGDAYKAIVVFTTMDELKGYPESKTFVKADRCQIETDPQVLIVGAGHCGIQIAARFKQMGISALVVDRNRRVGDAWRNRYPSLHLHTIKDFSQTLYQPFPSDWPEFIPKDKLADWFEQYVINQDLVVWNSSTLVPKPAYNQATRRWTVNIKRADRSSVTLHPLHIIMAIGFMNKPRIPDVPGKSDFKGKIMHTSDFSSTYPVSDFRNKHLVIVGAGNSSGDISQFLVSSPNSSPASITIVQRSSTCVASLSTFTGQMKPIWPPSSVTPIEVADFRANAMPTALVRKININMAPIFKGMDKDMFDGLTEAGMRLNYGSDDSGPGILVRETASGLWIDVGCAELISSGKIKIKSSASTDQLLEIQQITQAGLAFSDGTYLNADIILFATGFENPRGALKDLFGSDVIDSTSEIWGLDEEDEQRGVFRPTGHPALWYAIADFFTARVASKTLAIHIQAAMAGVKN